jgi:glycosyltransferase 2 family protein
VPALAIYFFGVWLRSARWHYLLRPLRSLTPNALFPVVVIGYMANDVLPARLGEFVRAYVLGEREGMPKSAILATIAVERTFDGLAMLLFIVVVTTFFVPLDAQLQSIFQIAALVFLGALVAFFAVASSSKLALRLIDGLARILPARFRPGFIGLASRFLAGLGVFQSWRLVLATFVLSVAAWLAEAGMYLLVAIGFGLTLPATAYVLTTAFANLAGMVPSAPGYVGPFEFGALASLSLFGMSADRALSYILVLHAALLVPVTLLGFVYLWRYGLSLRSLWSSKSRSEG